MKEYQVVVSRPRWEHAVIVVEAENKSDAYIKACEAADEDPHGSEYEWEPSDNAGDAEGSSIEVLNG